MNGRWSGLLALCGALLVPAPAASQGGMGGSVLMVNSEAEAYLRNLQVAGAVAAHPWSIRGFTAREADALAPADSAHPWAASGALRRALPARGVHLSDPELRLGYNSAFPFGGNDGAVWAGRGATAALQGGVAVRWGVLSASLAPVAVWAQNDAFALMPAGEGRLRFAQPGTSKIDFPQRPGDGAYARVDPGQSWVRLELPGVTAGLSTANQHWGPAAEHPLLLGSNAPGFTHAFLGTSAPVPVGIGRLHTRLVWGDLRQSDYSALEGDRSRRFMSGMVAVFTPRGVDHLELGVGSFVHASWPEDGPGFDDLVEPLSGLFFSGTQQREDTTERRRNNQIASVFGRWVFPSAGLEVYGEYAREDRAADLRNALVEPDHDAAYVLGLRKVRLAGAGSMWVFRGEVLSTQRSHLDLINRRTRFYEHSFHRQGHTHRGQLLGTAAGHGGAATVLGVDYYHPRGRWTASFSRELRRDPADYPAALAGNGRPDVVNALGVEAVRFARGGVQLTGALRGVYELNRDFGDDAFNLNAQLGVRAAL